MTEEKIESKVEAQTNLPPTDLALIARINDLVARTTPDWYGSEAKLHGEPRIERRAWSYLLQYHIRSQRPDEKSVKVYLKISRRPEINALEEAIQNENLRHKTCEEYQNMQAVQEVFQTHTDMFCFIKPLAYLVDFNAVVMEELPSRPLKELLIKPQISLGFKSDWNQLLKVFSLAGQWLKVYHQAGNPQMLPADAQQLEEIAWPEFDRLQTATQGQVNLSGLKACLRRMIAELEQERPHCMITTLHGDFNCANVIIDEEGRVGALDVGYKRGIIYEDLAKLITDPATRKEQVLSKGAMIRPAQLGRIRAAVFEGYFGSQPVHHGLLNFYSTTTIMRKWAMNEEEISYNNKFPRQLNNLLRSQMRSYLQRIIEQRQYR